MTVRSQRIALLAALVVAAAAAVLVCACDTSPPSTELYPHPFPDERLRRADGSIDISAFPEGTDAALARETRAALDGARGFGTASGFFFPFDVPLDEASLPTVEESVTPGASVFVVNVDRGSPAYGARTLVHARFLDDAGPFGGTNLLVVLPYPGAPLVPDTLYAAVVTRDVRALDGLPLTPRADRGDDTGTTPAHDEAARALASLGVDDDSILARAVVRTDDPTRGLREAVAQVLAEEPVALGQPELTETFPGYCVFHTSVAMPVYQEGMPPYAFEGGGWRYDATGALVLASRLDANVWITVPRARDAADDDDTDGTDTNGTGADDTPRAVLPSAVFVRAGGGGDRPLVDRGPRDADGRSARGTGIARELARAGYVGLSVDGPLGGARNLAGWDEQTTVFNLANPIALRDNVRQSALELVLFAHALASLSFDASACEGAPPVVRVDPEPVLIAHSTGATIAPLAAAVEPRYRALVMSGAGASWIRQIVHKESPMPIRPFAEALLGYWPHRALVEHDPILSMIEWAGEPADPLVYGRLVQDRPVLVFQGIVDTYILPPIANPVAMSLGLDLGGEALDVQIPGRGALDDIALVGGRARTLPADLDTRPRLVVQHEADGIEDGHEVLFQRPEARRQLRCFLASLADGHPRVVAPTLGRDAACE